MSKLYLLEAVYCQLSLKWGTQRLSKVFSDGDRFRDQLLISTCLFLTDLFEVCMLCISYATSPALAPPHFSKNQKTHLSPRQKSYCSN